MPIAIASAFAFTDHSIEQGDAKQKAGREMGWFVALVAATVAAWIGYKIGAARRRTDKFVAVASEWNLEQARAALKESYSVACAQMADPVSSGTSVQTATEHIERATAAMDRIQQLQGREHGAKFRLSFRPQLVQRIREEVDRLTQECSL